MIGDQGGEFKIIVELEGGGSVVEEVGFVD